MDKRLVIFGLCVFAAAGGCTQTRVVRDNSVVSQFAKLDGINGAHVIMGDGSTQVKPKVRPPTPTASADPWTGYNPFAHSQWSTNFRVTDPAGTNTTVAPAPPTLTGAPAPEPQFIPTLLPPGEAAVAPRP